MKKYIILIVLILICTAYVVYDNLSIQTTYISIESQSLPASFDGYRIAQISDFHNRKDYDHIIEILKKTQPNIITITGDLVDSSHTNIEIAFSFVEQLMKIAPCYYVTGNHEAWLNRQDYEYLEEKIKDVGVQVLHNKTISLKKGSDFIQLIGVDDPAYIDNDSFLNENIMEKCLLESDMDKDVYSILLSHRPELFDVYVENQVDLVLSGHAHGGQFRLPFIGGIIAPDQGFFPKYDAGLYHQNQTHMIVSRGLGNSVIPIRFHNMPEVIMIDLNDIY